MAQKRLFWQLFPSYLVITLASLLCLMWYVTDCFRDFYVKQLAADLQARAGCLEEQASRLAVEAAAERADRFCKAIGEKSDARLTLILPSGKVIGDSAEDPARMDNHGDRPEILSAFAGEVGRSRRHSYTLGTSMMYVAIPLREGDRLVGALRVSVPTTTIDRRLRLIYMEIGTVGLVVACMAAAVSLVVSGRITRPLEELRRGVERFAKGDFAHALSAPGSEEMAALAEAMNEMAVQLDDRIRMVVRQRNELGAVLSSMVEGVLAVDGEERLISMNEAAARFLGSDAAQAKGQDLREVVRNVELQRLAAKALSSREPVESEIVLRDEHGERFVQVRGAVLRDGAGGGIGALLVLHDVTHLRRLENVRRDFVANVSHELKTPVTSIKGFVETLLDGAMRNPDEAKHFLEIAAKQADRLNAIIEDLLTLSRIEQGDGKAAPAIALEPQAVLGAIQGAVQVCEVKARAKDIALAVTCPEDLAARINAPLLEQAVVNLIDNAVKYSDKGATISVEVVADGPDLLIRVRDHGCGIEKEHLPRIFERFYRVDKARSRKLGGTGLGLAIVKHIIQAHGGTVSVESVPGQGSTFTLRLPKA